MQTDTNTPTNQAATAQLDDLIVQAKQVAADIDSTNKEADAQLKSVEAKVDEAAAELEKIYADFDQIDNEASDQLDTLILQQADQLAAEEQHL